MRSHMAYLNWLTAYLRHELHRKKMFIIMAEELPSESALQALFQSVEWMIQMTDSNWPICPRFGFAQCS